MKKKLLMLGASMLILGNSQISYGAAAFELEGDDKSRQSTVVPELPLSETELVRDVEKILYREGDETIKVIFRVVYANGTSKREEKILPKKEEGGYFPEIAHDNIYSHVTFPRTIVYGEDEDGNRYEAGVWIEDPIFHVHFPEECEDWGEPQIKDGKKIQIQRHTTTYKRVKTDNVIYSVYYDTEVDYDSLQKKRKDEAQMRIHKIMMQRLHEEEERRRKDDFAGDVSDTDQGEDDMPVDVPMARPAAAVAPPPAATEEQ